MRVKKSLWMKVLTLMVVLGLGFAASMAEARESRHQAAKRVKQAPRYAHIVVDAASGKVLDAEYADQTRHPASLTKVMTLYMTFAQIKAGKLSMNKPLRVSARAAAWQRCCALRRQP
ncbi:MAG: hypothetical protein EB121_04055 [Alphaproteobacteria bacterium]|nr:hypothetical protein [Alphaproteobacteria bacterium]